ncbi:MAG: hypothetical protein PHE55_20450 [Methylococcaceae bacterium]|nr:hypothetical protein [Methylococcaceae bacterium]
MAGSEFFTVELSGWQGLDTRIGIADKNPKSVEDCLNVDFEQGGVISKRRGFKSVLQGDGSSPVNLLYDFQSAQGFSTLSDSHRIIVARGTTCAVYTESFSAIHATFTVTDCLHYAVSSDNGACIVTNECAGEPKIIGYNGTLSSFFLEALQMMPPSGWETGFTGTGPLVFFTTFGSLTGVQNWELRYSYVDKYGNESNLIPTGKTSQTSASTYAIGVNAAYCSPSTLGSIVQMNLYMQKGGETDFYFLGTISNTTYAWGTKLFTISDETTLKATTPIVEDQYDSVPSGKYLAIYASSLVIAGDASLPDLVRLSYPGFYRQWDINSFARAASRDGQPVKGLLPYMDTLIVGKSGSIHSGLGTNDENFLIKTLDNDYGVAGQGGMTTAQRRYVVMADDGIYVGYGGNVFEELTEPIRPTYTALSKAALNADPSRAFCANFRFAKKLLFGVRKATGDGANDTILVWDYGAGGAFTMYSVSGCRYLAQLQDASKGRYLYGGDDVGNIWLFTAAGMDSVENNDTNNVTGASAAISAYFETPWLNLPRMAGAQWPRSLTEAAWAQIWAGGEPASGNSTITLQTTVYTDFSSTVKGTFSTTHAAVAYPGVSCDPKIISGFAGDSDVFEMIKLRISNNITGEHFKVHKIIFGFRARPTIGK